jgi:hypothetical protein
MKKFPDFEIRIPTFDDEMRYLLGELIPKYPLYREAGYTPKIPDNSTLKKAAQGGKSISVKRARPILSGFYDKNIYEKALQGIPEKLGKIWERLFESFLKWREIWGFRIFPKYEIRLTKFGTGGDYFPSYGAFDGKLRPQPGKKDFPEDSRAIILLKLNDRNAFLRDPLEIIVHEIVHLGIEEPIVRRFNLTHKQKEALVDRICLLEFLNLLPNYKPQKIKNTMLKNLLKTKEDIRDLPQLISVLSN